MKPARTKNKMISKEELYKQINYAEKLNLEDKAHRVKSSGEK